jgi:hypothetical protein
MLHGAAFILLPSFRFFLLFLPLFHVCKILDRQSPVLLAICTLSPTIVSKLSQHLLYFQCFGVCHCWLPCPVFVTWGNVVVLRGNSAYLYSCWQRDGHTALQWGNYLRPAVVPTKPLIHSSPALQYKAPPRLFHKASESNTNEACK